MDTSALLSRIVLLLSVIGAAHGSIGHHGHRCSFHFQEYLPSAFEQLWLSNSPSWGASAKAFCDAVTSQEAIINQLLIEATIEKVMHPSTEEVPHEFLSRFKYLRNCSTGTPGTYKSTIMYSYIEPLATSLRQPASFCLGGDMLGRTHYLLSSGFDPTGIIANITGRVFMFDLGASTWAQGAGGSSQDFFYNTYKKHGLEINRMLMWEVTKYNPAKLFDEVPDEAFHAYQYFNIPANLEPGNKKNPLEILRKIAHPDDFVLVKLDIDNSSLENAYIAQLLADPALLSLVDEMFFEHHVNFEPLWRNWGSSADKNLFLADSYKLFFSFRQKGVRFHGWP